MDIKQLEYFVAIVNSKYNLRKTAEKLHVSQPLLTIVINEIESEYGIKLLVKKNGRYVDLTSEGRVLFENAKTILKTFKHLEMELKSFKNVHHGTVKVGIPPIIISTFFNSSIPKFINKYPNIKLEIIERGANVLYKMLKDKEIDYAIILDFQGSDPDLTTTYLCSDSLATFINYKHKLATKKYISFADLDEEKVVLLNEDFVLNTIIKKKFSEHFITPRITFTSTQWDLLLQLVEDTNVITILPKSVENKLKVNNIKVIELTPKIKWKIAIITNNDVVKSPTALLFENFITDYYKNNIDYK